MGGMVYSGTGGVVGGGVRSDWIEVVPEVGEVPSRRRMEDGGRPAICAALETVGMAEGRMRINLVLAVLMAWTISSTP